MFIQKKTRLRILYFTEQPIIIKKTKEELHEKNFIVGCFNDADHDDDFLPKA